MFVVWVVASSRVSVLVSVGSAAASVISATPEALSRAAGIMKMLLSAPLGRAAVAPSIRPLPLCASAPSLPSALALMMNCRSAPWQGKKVLPVPLGAQLAASRRLTTVLKLKPKSASVTTLVFAVGSKLAMDCGVCVAVVREPSVAELVFDAASLSAGFSPPTRFVTATAVLPDPRRHEGLDGHASGAGGAAVRADSDGTVDDSHDACRIAL
jgi:hypothetical protein